MNTKFKTEKVTITLTKPAFIEECCKVCPNWIINEDYCYNGKSCFECPAYNNESEQPPTDIELMLLNN